MIFEDEPVPGYPLPILPGHTSPGRLERLRDGSFDDGRRGARVGRRHLHLRRNDVGKLRDRNAGQRDRAGDRDDDGDDDRKARPVDENRRKHQITEQRERSRG